MLTNPIARRRLWLPLALAVAFVACGPGPFAPRPSGPNISTAFEIWAVTGSPTPFPTAFSVQSNTTLRLEPTGNFDFAIDITPAGRLQVLPVGRVVSPVTGARTTAFQVPTVAFDLVTAAPRGGWVADTTLELDVGGTFLVQVLSNFCTFSANQLIHGKFRVDSINVAERRAYIVGRINPSCGFRSFADGVPEF